MKLRNSFHPYAMITIVFWSLAYVLTRLALQYFSAFSLGFLRYFTASCTLAVVAVYTRMKLPHKADLPTFLAAGAAGFFFYLSNEGVSILENAAHIGLPIPEKLKNALEQLHGRSNEEDEKK